MKTVLEDKLTCPKCRMAWYYGWESLGLCASYLVAGVTAKGKNGAVRFTWLRCADCKYKVRIASLRLVE